MNGRVMARRRRQLTNSGNSSKRHLSILAVLILLGSSSRASTSSVVVGPKADQEFIDDARTNGNPPAHPAAAPGPETIATDINSRSTVPKTVEAVSEFIYRYDDDTDDDADNDGGERYDTSEADQSIEDAVDYDAEFDALESYHPRTLKLGTLMVEESEERKKITTTTAADAATAAATAAATITVTAHPVKSPEIISLQGVEIDMQDMFPQDEPTTDETTTDAAADDDDSSSIGSSSRINGGVSVNRPIKALTDADEGAPAEEAVTVPPTTVSPPAAATPTNRTRPPYSGDGRIYIRAYPRHPIYGNTFRGNEDPEQLAHILQVAQMTGLAVTLVVSILILRCICRLAKKFSDSERAVYDQSPPDTPPIEVQRRVDDVLRGQYRLAAATTTALVSPPTSLRSAADKGDDERLYQPLVFSDDPAGPNYEGPDYEARRTTEIRRGAY